MAADDVIPLHLADVTFPDWHPLRGQVGEVFAFALQHQSGLILYETGVGRGNAFIDEVYQVVQHPLEAELEAHGLRTADVRLIVNSHLHFDHCGNNPLFAGVPIYVQAIEYEATRQRHYTVPEWIDFEGAEYAVLDGDSQLARGVRVVATPGHSTGHQSLVLETRNGTIALAGQAVYSKIEYEHLSSTGTLTDDDPPPDPVRYLESARRLIDLRPRRVYFSHDRAAWSANEAAETDRR